MADINGEGNPVEAKYRRLARSHRTGRGDRELKPGPDMRDLLNVSVLKVRLVFEMVSLMASRLRGPGPVPTTAYLCPVPRRQGFDLALQIFAQHIQAFLDQVLEIGHLVRHGRS